jgi:tungstate transport system substrate-binding protein
MKYLSAVFASLVVTALLSGCGRTNAPLPDDPHVTGHTISVDVIGGMVETGFWKALGERFEQKTGNKIELVASGPKDVIADAFKSGKADVITMHACDTIINLVADGYAMDPKPWLRNDLIIVGPPSDPAGIRNFKSAGKAFARINSTKSPFVVHSSLGAQDVMRDILHTTGLEINPDILTVLFSDRARDVLKIAAAKNAYTMVGRIPFRNGKLPNAGLEIMVRGDPALRRPYVVAIANPDHFHNADIAGAKTLVAFLLNPDTQQWISTFGVGQLDDGPIFFPLQPTAP